MKSHLPISTTQHAMRFGDLSAADFERLCLGLLENLPDEWQQVQHYGQAGSDEGRDIVAERNGARWAVQCKRYQSNTIGAQLLKNEVDKCHALDAALRPAGILFITSANVTAATRDEVSAYCQARGFACEIWGRTDLDARVNRHPPLVAQFFGAASTPLNPALHQVAAPVADFVGRIKELTDLTQHLQPKTEQTQTVAIAAANGTGGIGKTQLALKLVAALREAYPDAQLFINLRGVTLPSEQSVTPVEALQQFIRALEPAAQATHLPDEVDELRGKYLSLLQGRRALIVCDNARDRAQVEPLLPSPGCALIVTSRTAIALPGVLTRHLDKLAPDEAVALLQSIVPHLNESAAAQLAALCGYFPQALRVYGNFLAERPSYPAQRYAARIAEAQARGELEPEIAAAFEASYSELLDAAQQQHWRQLAVFASDFDAKAAAAVWQLDSDDALDKLSELARFSLIEYDAARDRYGWHDLARVYAQGLLADDEREELMRRYAIHYCVVLRSANKLYGQGQPLVGLQRYDAERAHIATGFAWAQQNCASDPTASELCLKYPDLPFLLQLRLHPRAQIEWLIMQLAAARQLQRRQVEGVALCNLGSAYLYLGEVRQAIAHYEQHLAIARETGDRRGEAMALGNLGCTYKNSGEMRQAIEYHEQALIIAREIGDRRGEGAALGNLGLAYADLGEVRQAIAHYEQQLVIVREIGDRRGEADALGGLGSAYVYLDEVRQAYTYYEKQLVIAREIGDRRGEGNALGNLGLVYAVLGEVRQAITHYEQALMIVREIGDRHGEGAHLGNLGLVYADLGEVRQAIVYYLQALMIAREIDNRLGEATASWNIARALRVQGETERARSLAHTALELFEALEFPTAAKVRAELAEWDAAA